MFKIFRQLPVLLFLLVLPLSGCGDATESFSGWWKETKNPDDSPAYIELSFDGSPSIFSYIPSPDICLVSKSFYTKREATDSKLVLGLPASMEDIQMSLNGDILTRLATDNFPAFEYKRDKDFGKSAEATKAVFKHADKIENTGLQMKDSAVLKMSFAKRQISLFGELEKITGEKSLQLLYYIERRSADDDGASYSRLMIRAFSDTHAYLFTIFAGEDGFLDISKTDLTGIEKTEELGPFVIEPLTKPAN